MITNLGIIGCGSISQHRHIAEAAVNPGCRIAALCDTNRERAETVAKQYGDPAVFTDHREMLQKAKLDAVVVATPNKFHAPQSIDALTAGKHVLVEKPMAGTREEAKTMMRAAAEHHRFLMIGLNQRLMPPHVKAKEILDTGKLGPVLTFQTTFKHPGPEGWSVDGIKSWFFKRDEAIMGVTGDLGVHKADLMRFLLGQEFTRVGGMISTLHKRDADNKPISVDDNACLTLQTTGGAIGTMTISWTNYGGFEDNGTVLYCENGVLKISEDPRFGVAVYYTNGQREFHELGGVSTNTKQVNSGIMDQFLKSIHTNQPPTINGREGYKSLDIILTAMEAATAGKILPIQTEI